MPSPDRTSATTGRRDATSLRSIDPPRGSDVTLRAPIAQRLEQATGGVAVVHAPSGYGKTSTVAAWAQSQRRPVRWIELEGWDNDPATLLAVVVHALEAVTDFDASELSVPHGSHERYSTTVAPMLGRSVRRCHRPFVLVLDDAHLVVEQPALDLVDALVQHVPPGSTVVLVGRVEPRLRLARLRVDDKVEEITATDLALDVPAARELLTGMGVILDDAEVGRLVAATEGWAVGLRLAGRGMLEEAADHGAPVLRDLDHDPVVADYLHEEWLGGLGADELDFLVQASWLDSLSAPLCDAVFNRSDSDELLDRLHTDRVLVIPLASRGEQYRMHRLLRSVLLARSERDHDDRRRTIEERASSWYEGAGDIDRAIRFALCADDGARGERLVEQYGPGRLTTGHVGTVRRWLEMFPHSQVIASAPLCIMAAAAAIGLGEADTALKWLEFAQHAAESSGTEDDQTLSRIRALRSVTVTRVDAGELTEAARAYDELTPGIWRALACWGYGWLSFATGDDESAARLLAEGAAEAHVAGAVTIEAQCRASSAVLSWESGDRVQATASARTARAIVRSHGWESLPTLVLVTAMSALVEAADGNPTEAAADIALTRRNLVYVRAVATWSNVQCRLALARASLMLGDRVGARTSLDEAEQMVAEMPTASRSAVQLAELHERLDRTASSLPYGPSSLTTAELRVLHFLPTNLTLAEIAQRLYVSRNTTKTHAATVYRKLGVSSRGEAVELARAAGLLASGVAEPSSR